MADFKPPANRSDLRWIAMDWDGTLFQNSWSPNNPTAGIGKPIFRNIDKLHELVDAGYKIQIHTARPWGDHELLMAAADHYHIPVHGIVAGKILAAAYIDDRAISADERDWLGLVREINS